ncbi:MAG: molybdopterin oxidoreductase family protein [Ardenticatenaceae bacterium]|nr:molybdopterin oxidoreductase family protein [Ardenticatenaceae bacterium]MCB8989755.1 molybdopterin oxidoreductase family protein [Ardenticatenaceae bacterium]MCB9002786.1 molybdopterin oxidoreductase family protein [Ardenticatenaceae bacterium]
MITKVHGVCPHDCPDTCGLITEVENGRAIHLSGDPDHPITRGWLCAKVRPYLNHVYHPDRLTRPLRRVGPKGGGQWQPISWDEAISEIGQRWRAIIAEYGAEAILPYSYSGTLGMVQMGAASARLWNRMGASQLDRAICGAAAEFAVKKTLGKRYSQPYSHVQHSKLVIIWGHNPVSTAPHFMPFLREAQRNGTQLVVIDPRRTRTAVGADWHIAPKPATDGALALGLAHVIVNEGLHNEDWLNAYTVGWPELRARLADYPPERVADITGVAAADIVKLARLYAGTQPALIKIADGLQRNRVGGQTVRAICALPALTAQYGQRGGGLAYSTSGYVKWNGRALSHWQDTPPLGRVVNMNRLGAALLGEVADPPIQSLYVFGSNPVAIAPHAGKVITGLRREDLFTVVHELFMTDTAVYADIVLPATSQLEHADLHKAYGHTVLSYNAPAIAPLGEAKSNWDVMRLLAAEMGFTEAWLQQTADEVIAEVLAGTAEINPALQGITLERLKAEGSIPLHFVPETPFADLRFPTPSGKVELFSANMAEMGLDPLPGYTAAGDDGADEGQPLNGQFPPQQALNLISAAAHHFVTSTFANRADMLAREGEPFVEIHPDDAAARGIASGDSVVVENGRGCCELTAKVTDAVRPGVVASPKGRWGGGNGNGRTINHLTSDTLGDMAGQSTFHSNLVWIRRSNQ